MESGQCLVEAKQSLTQCFICRRQTYYIVEIVQSLTEYFTSRRYSVLGWGSITSDIIYILLVKIEVACWCPSSHALHIYYICPRVMTGVELITSGFGNNIHNDHLTSFPLLWGSPRAVQDFVFILYFAFVFLSLLLVFSMVIY